MASNGLMTMAAMAAVEAAPDERALPSLDHAFVGSLLAGESAETTLDRLAADLMTAAGMPCLAIIAVRTADGVVVSAEGRQEHNAHLIPADLDLPGHAGEPAVRIFDAAGLRPLQNGVADEADLRAIAAGHRCCLRLPVRPAGGSGSGGVLAVYGPADARQSLHLRAAMQRTAELAALALRLAETMERANDGDTRFAALASTIPGVIYQRVVQPSGQIRYTYISENAVDLFGVTAEKILTDPEALFTHYSKDYRDTFRQKLLKASQEMTLWDVEATILRPDGQTRYTHAIARPNREPDGSVVWTGVILDATRIKEAEMAATAAEARTREAIVESLSQGILLFDHEDRLTLRNSHFFKLYPALETKASIGTHYEDILRCELDPEHNPDVPATAAISELEDRLARHGEAHLVYEREMVGDRFILINEYRTPNEETVVLYTDISELKRRERKIEHLAHHDALTGLPNRVLFRERLDQALRDARTKQQSVAVICLDLDHFKSINDTLGHQVGDVLLKDVAKRVQDLLLDSDTACRLGGDEFAIIRPMVADPTAVTSLAWRMLDALAQPFSAQGHTVMSGTSIGIAISGQDGNDPEALLKNADLALYRAKADGRGTFRFFEREMDAKAQARRMMEIALRTAISREELEVHYQPLVDAQTSQVMGAEALLRWNVPGQGYISPSEFVPLAEETGLISDIGLWVLRKACTEAANWPSEIRIAVNISPAQFRNVNFVEKINEIIAESGLNPERLEIEITEGMLLSNTEVNTRILIALKSLGIRISMDDFGTGYSSLGNLRSFPFDKIKIDKSFIADLDKGKDAAAIIRAILTLGHSMGMTTTAEGVETRAQLTYLRAEGCMEVQGYFFAQALTNDKIAEVLRYNSGVMTGKNVGM
jgi:diguanylate cyclase (GGDEF)-like protein/PAS domain S-box-containing protein